MVLSYLLVTIFLLWSVAAQDQTFADGYIIKWHPGQIKPENRRTWIDNQLRKASLPPLTEAQVASLKVCAYRRLPPESSAHPDKCLPSQIGWESSVFDGFAGNISTEAVNAFMNSGDCVYAVPGMYKYRHPAVE
jgi:hypothetical protein